MNSVWMFFGGLFLANGIPHFVHGISGEAFHTPRLHRLLPGLPSPVVNVVWGLLNFGLAVGFASLAGNPPLTFGADWLAASAGFAFAAIGLSIYFPRRTAAQAARRAD